MVTPSAQRTPYPPQGTFEGQSGFPAVHQYHSYPWILPESIPDVAVHPP